VLVRELQAAAELELQRQVADQRVARLQDAVRKITQRVNLFEKVLIPRAEANIRKIVLFLSDQECAAVVRSKIAKSKTLTEGGSGSSDERSQAYGDR
jgi:V/A-type H+-transporting ATPase subunit D